MQLESSGEHGWVGGGAGARHLCRFNVDHALIFGHGWSFDVEAG
jgi:hypothetical protein